MVRLQISWGRGGGWRGELIGEHIQCVRGLNSDFRVFAWEEAIYENLQNINLTLEYKSRRDR